MSPTTRAMVHAIAINSKGALRDSALDELAAQDRALERGRMLSRDWTGELGTPLPPPMVALPAPRIPRKLPRLCDAAREALSAVRAKAAPYARDLLAKAQAALKSGLAWGAEPLVAPQFEEMSWQARRAVSEWYVIRADNAMRAFKLLDERCFLAACAGALSGLILIIADIALGA